MTETVNVGTCRWHLMHSLTVLKMHCVALNPRLSTRGEQDCPNALCALCLVSYAQATPHCRLSHTQLCAYTYAYTRHTARRSQHFPATLSFAVLMQPAVDFSSYRDMSDEGERQVADIEPPLDSDPQFEAS